MRENHAKSPIQGMIYLPEIKKIGNNILHRIMNMEGHGDSTIYSSHILEEYDSVQRMLVACSSNIEKLMSWRNDGRTDTWKWLSPFVAEPEKDRFVVFDHHNMGFLSDAYKGRAGISLMTPDTFLSLANHGEFVPYNDISKLKRKMSCGTPIDTPFLIFNKTEPFSHEGRHRAQAAKEVGIKLIPVYMYSHHFLSDHELRMLGNNDFDKMGWSVPQMACMPAGE